MIWYTELSKHLLCICYLNLDCEMILTKTSRPLQSAITTQQILAWRASNLTKQMKRKPHRGLENPLNQQLDQLLRRCASINDMPKSTRITPKECRRPIWHQILSFTEWRDDQCDWLQLSVIRDTVVTINHSDSRNCDPVRIECPNRKRTRKVGIMYSRQRSVYWHD